MISINIKDPLFTSNNGQLVNIFDFNPKKLSIKKVTDAVSDDPECIYYVKYDKDTFYFDIDDVKGYFRYYKDKKESEFIMKDQIQAKIYNQIWNKIKVYEKYNEIWEVVRKLLKAKFTVGPVRDDKYLTAKLKIFNGINRTTFSNNAIPIERTSYNCISAIDIDSVLKIDNKRAYPQAYLEQCKYKLRKRKIVNFIDDEIIDEDSENDSDINDELKL